MEKKIFSTLAVGAFLFSGLAWGGDLTTSPIQQVAQAQEEEVYGSQIMTPEERTLFRDRMRAATSQEERERIRREHHEEMKVRAAQRGLTLPDEPPQRGLGGGMGSGPGPGPGGGMGGGRR